MTMAIDPDLKKRTDALDAFYRANQARIDALRKEGFFSLVFNKAGDLISGSKVYGEWPTDEEVAELARKNGGKVFPFSFGGHID